MPRKGYRKPAHEARNIPVNVRLSPQEKSHLEACVDASEVTGVADFLRLLIAGHDIKPRRPNAYAELINEVACLNRKLASIDNNMNQLARAANMGQMLSENAFDQLLEDHRDLCVQAGQLMAQITSRR